MGPSTTSPALITPTTVTAAPPKDGVVVTGFFEPALSVQQLAEELHVNPRSIYDLRSQGRGPTSFRVGRHLRFRLSEIEAWLALLEGLARPARGRGIRSTLRWWYAMSDRA